jgi:hypothetical protein
LTVMVACVDEMQRQMPAGRARQDFDSFDRSIDHAAILTGQMLRIGRPHLVQLYAVDLN